jgi:acyl-CoA synthetase (AMP-forming)/AMP-acid ligase II
MEARGLKPGARVCLLMKNSPDVMLLFYAMSVAGLIIVPLNYRLAPREWVDIAVDAEAAAIVADSDFIEPLNTCLKSDDRLRGVQRLCTEGQVADWAALLTDDSKAPLPLPHVSRSAEDIVFQMYTSGTTGKPKGAMISHRSMVASMMQSNFAAPHKPSPGDRSLVVLPTFHIAAIATALTAVSCGACLVIHRDVNPVAVAKALSEERITIASFVPAVIQMLLVSVPGLKEMKFPDLKYIGYGASPIAEPVLRRAMEVFDCHFAQGYGMTELAGSCCMLTESDHRRALAGRPELLLSAGKAIPGAEVRVVDSDDKDVPQGSTGEVIVRGAQLMTGYWNMPDATREALRGGWMHTGDAGYLDEKGYLFIRDRVKDMIVSGAENIYPAEIEAVLHAHPNVSEVAVIGVPDSRWGETVMAVVVSKPGSSLTKEELDQLCRSRLGGFKVPRQYKFVDSLPRNASGKILKRQLRQEFWPQDGRQVS